MKFVISVVERPYGLDWRSAHVWTLHDKDGPFCTSSDMWDTKQEARSAISKAKTTMKGARYAKVFVQ